MSSPPHSDDELHDDDEQLEQQDDEQDQQHHDIDQQQHDDYNDVDDVDGDDLDGLSGDEDEVDISQPMPPSQYFGRSSQSDEQGDANQHHEQYDDNLESGDGEASGVGSSGADGVSGTSSYPSISSDALSSADALPAFANTEVRVLDASVKAKEKLLQKFIDEEEENKERVAIMAEHLKNVRSERVHSQQLVDAKQRDIETESHLKQLAERETGRIETDSTKVGKYTQDIQDKLNSIQNNHFVASEKLEMFKQQMNWNQEELLQWSLAAKQKDEDREALKNYEKVDSSKLKHLTLKMENMARLEQEKKLDLDNAITETQSIQIELNKTAEEYRKNFQEKQALIQQWDEAEVAMQKRDQTIAQVGEIIQKGRMELRVKEKQVAEQKQFLEQEQNNNKQLNVQIGMYERVSEKTRNELNNAKRELIEFEDEVATQRSELEKAESELKTTRVTNQSLQQQRTDKLQRLQELQQAVEEARNALKTEYSTTDNLADRAKQVDSLHKEHLARLQQTNKGLQQLKESMFKHSHELFNKRKQEADLIAEISGAQGTSRNLQQRIHELDQRSLKQQEMLYNIEFQVQQLERKVSHASGKRSLEDTMLLNQQIAALQEQLTQQQQQHSIIINQVKKLQDDLRAAKRQYRDICQEKENLTERISRIQLENESSDREVKDMIKRKEDLIVSHDVLKLEVKRLREQLNLLADQVLTLENRRTQLQLSMKEREKEVELHADIQRSEQKSAEEQRHALAMDLKERQIKVDKLKKKYETVAGKLHKADEQEHSQAYYIIAAAQEREELQREGDELNKEIRQCEAELAALNNTQSMLNGRNALYRAGLQKPDPAGPDAQIKQQLEEQQRASIDKLYKHRSYLREIAGDFEDRRNILAQLLNSIGQQQQELQQSSAEYSLLSKQIQEQHAQLQRATNNMNAKRAEYRRRAQLRDNEESVEELYMNLLEQKRKNRLMLQLIRDFTDKHGDVSYPLQNTLEELGIKLSRPSSSASSTSSKSSRPDSAASSRPVSSSSQASNARRPPSGSINLPSIRAIRTESKENR